MGRKSHSINADINAAFFFFAEFTLVLATVCLGVASYDQISLCITSGFSWNNIFYALIVFPQFIFYALVTKEVFTVAARLTSAMLRLENRMHKLNAQVNSD